jgi:ubiquinone/menaquinone biosynthesis C-methylase UbiE
LRKRVPRVTSLEYNNAFAIKLAQNYGHNSVVQCDAAALPFPDRSFSSAIAILVLHHLPSTPLQDRSFAEVHRVLRPGGCFLAFEVPNSWFNRVIHINSTFVPVESSTLSARLTAAGFADVVLDRRPGGFRLRASR